MTQRIQVAAEHRIAADGTAFFTLYDSVDGAPVCRHSFLIGGAQSARAGSTYVEAQREVAQAIAYALNGAPPAAIEHVRMAMREATMAGIMAQREMRHRDPKEAMAA